MRTARLSLAGIAAEGRHGANPGERLEAQTFLVDLEVIVDVGADTLDRTLDYRVAAEVARETIERTSHVLLESLAEAVARAVFEFSPVVEVTAVVHKPGAAASIGIDDVSAEAVVRA